MVPILRQAARRNMLSSKSIAFDEQDIWQPSTTAISEAIGAAGEEFVDRLRSGDPAAFDNLINRYTGDIYGLLCRLNGNADEAADQTQETFLKALRAIKTFRGEADLKTWLFRIAVNVSRNRFRWWRRRGREATYSLDATFGDGDTSFAELLRDTGESPEAAVLRLERERWLRNALQLLSADFREAIVLRDIEGLTYEEVAIALNVNLGTVKSRIARGREELRKRLDDF